MSQLNDDTYYDFDALVVLVDELDEAAELAAYDVVILGDAGYTSADWSGFEAELELWVDGGGGLVVTGYGARQSVCDAAPTVASLLPVLCDDAEVEGAAIAVDDPTHPISDEVPDFTLVSYVHSDTSPSLAVDGSGLMLASDGNWAVAVRDHGLGRVVYLAPAYMGKTSFGSSYLRTGEEDLLIEEAVAWAGGCIDADGDGGLDSGCGGDDCDDGDPTVYFGAVEACNAIDDDCDGAIPDTEIDDDGDGIAECEGDCDDDDPAVGAEDLDADGYTLCTGDCDDGDSTIHEGADEIPYDGIDQDCDDDDLTDVDGDGHDANLVGGFDCDDEDPGTHPDADETCDDGIDNDCDGAIDDEDDDCTDGDDDDSASTDDDDSAPDDDSWGGAGDTDGCACDAGDAARLAHPELLLFALALLRRRG